MNEIHHRNFGQLLCDAIFFEKMAKKESDQIILRKYARSSILMSTLTLECAANCCLNQFSANKQLLNDIDKLPFLSKFDLFAVLGFEKKIDYGRTEVQKINELKHIRDSIVHSKVTKTKLGSINQRDRTFFAEAANSSFSIKPKSGTGILDNYQLVGHKDCFSALKSVIEFYNYFFSELLAMNKGLVFGLLNDTILSENEPAASYPPELFSEQEYLMSVGIEQVFWVLKP